MANNFAGQITKYANGLDWNYTVHAGILRAHAVDLARALEGTFQPEPSSDTVVITDAMVERGARAMLAYLFGRGCPPCSQDLEQARACLEAALQPGGGE